MLSLHHPGTEVWAQKADTKVPVILLERSLGKTGEYLGNKMSLDPVIQAGEEIRGWGTGTDDFVGGLGLSECVQVLG